MKLRNCFASVLLSVAYVGAMNAQTGAEIELLQATLTAGDPLTAKVTLDKPSPCDTSFVVEFISDQQQHEIDARGSIGIGKATATVTVMLPKDLPGGDYVSKVGLLLACPLYSTNRNIAVPARVATVKALPDPNEYPTTADLLLSVDQKKFLQTKITQLSKLSGELDTGVEKNSDDPTQLRRFLTSIVDRAQDQLDATEKDYLQQIMTPQDKLPVFFADFRAHYQALHIHLNSSIPGVGNPFGRPSNLLTYVQLKTRPAGEKMAGTRSPDVESIWHLIKDNIKAYLIVKDTGRAVFHARLSSYPLGARVHYKSVIDDQYLDYASPTNVSYATFDLAYWDFIFQKEGCLDDQTRHIDPYEENDPADISVEFTRCKGQR